MSNSSAFSGGDGIPGISIRGNQLMASYGCFGNASKPGKHLSPTTPAAGSRAMSKAPATDAVSKSAQIRGRQNFGSKFVPFARNNIPMRQCQRPDGQNESSGLILPSPSASGNL